LLESKRASEHGVSFLFDSYQALRLTLLWLWLGLD